jgi:hypothetical protein
MAAHVGGYDARDCFVGYRLLAMTPLLSLRELHTAARYAMMTRTEVHEQEQLFATKQSDFAIMRIADRPGDGSLPPAPVV